MLLAECQRVGDGDVASQMKRRPGLNLNAAGERVPESIVVGGLDHALPDVGNPFISVCTAESQGAITQLADAAPGRRCCPSTFVRPAPSKVSAEEPKIAEVPTNEPV